MMNYYDKVILAPMVRVTTLPMRLLAINYGADLVYSEEIVDFKLLKSKRKINNELNTVEFVMDDGTVVFKTCKEEKDKVVLQLATSDSERGLAAAKMIENDVFAVDLNMGCPKDYSVKGGMGAAMLKDPENACKILRNLVNNLKIPVTCKIRILHEKKQTLDLVKMLKETGVSAIAVHGRFTEERPSNPVHEDFIKDISDAFNKEVPIIANGGSHEHIKNFSDISYFKQICNVSSVMIARSAMHNPSIFKDFNLENTNPPTAIELVQQYIKLSAFYDNYISSTKYCIIQMLYQTPECEGYRETLSASTYKELCDIWNLTDFYKSKIEERNTIYEPEAKKLKLNNENYDKQINGKCKFMKRFYGKTGWSPKLELNKHVKKNNWPVPKFTIVENSTTKLFYSTLVVNNVLYTNDFGIKNKRHSDQAVASICLYHLGLIPSGLINNGMVIEIV